MPTENTIREELKDVIDPELGINIVDLGLIYEITTGQDVPDDAKDDAKAHVLMTLTTPGCPLHDYFRDKVSETVADAGGYEADDVEVEFTFDPPWSREKMTDEGKAELGFL